jgi:hypothetical protein
VAPSAAEILRAECLIALAVSAEGTSTQAAQTSVRVAPLDQVASSAAGEASVIAGSAATAECEINFLSRAAANSEIF